MLIVPGFIKAYAYAMTPYIAVEYPELSPADCIKMSNDMMKGNKGRLFLLDLSFIGWFLLGIATFFAGFLFIIPYYSCLERRFTRT
ncbi:MAG TPA: DUF975 family protein [Clostridia bacterium]